MSMQFKGRYGESAFVIASRKVQHQKVEGCSSFLGLLHKACSEASDFQKSELFDIFLELDAVTRLCRVEIAKLVDVVHVQAVQCMPLLELAPTVYRAEPWTWERLPPHKRENFMKDVNAGIRITVFELYEDTAVTHSPWVEFGYLCDLIATANSGAEEKQRALNQLKKEGNDAAYEAQRRAAGASTTSAKRLSQH